MNVQYAIIECPRVLCTSPYPEHFGRMGLFTVAHMRDPGRVCEDLLADSGVSARFD